MSEAPRDDRGDDPEAPAAHLLLARWIMGVVGGAALLQAAWGIGTGRLTYSVGDFGDDTRVLTAPGELTQGVLCFAIMGGLLFGFAMWPQRFQSRTAIVASLAAGLFALYWLGRLH
jgi:hypothetical protein